MRIIDDKGRIFGKINVIDFIIIFTLLCVLPAFYLGKKMLVLKKEIPAAVEKSIEIQVKFSNVTVELADVFREGDVERNPQGNVIGIMKKTVSNKLPETFSLDMKDNKFIIVPNPYSKSRDIVAIFDIKCAEKDRTLYFADCVIKIGNSFAFSTDLYTMSGVITAIKTQE
ncbi:MAG: DUF4330 domain-containing protein [Candidatus Omnitrophota bacterium]